MEFKKLDEIQKRILMEVADLHTVPEGAFNIRSDGKLAGRDALKAVENVDISDYDEAEQSIIQGYVDEAKKNIETAKTRKEVYDVITDFIADVEKVQTSKQKHKSTCSLLC